MKTTLALTMMSVSLNVASLSTPYSNSPLTGDLDVKSAELTYRLSSPLSPSQQYLPARRLFPFAPQHRCGESDLYRRALLNNAFTAYHYYYHHQRTASCIYQTSVSTAELDDGSDAEVEMIEQVTTSEWIGVDYKCTH